MTAAITNRILFAATNAETLVNWKESLLDQCDFLFYETELLALQNSVRINHPDLVVYSAALAANRLAEIASTISENQCCQLIIYRHNEDIDYSIVKPGIDVLLLPEQQALLPVRARHLLSEKAFQDLSKNSLIGYVDPLSGLYNRRMLYDVGEKELNRCQRYGRPFSLVTLKIDNLKEINLQLGFRAGDSLIHHLSTSILGHIRQSDLLARLGDSEFVILLPECHIEQCEHKLGEFSNLLKQVHPEFDGQKIPFTISAGAAEMDTGDIMLEQIIQRSTSELKAIG